MNFFFFCVFKGFFLFFKLGEFVPTKTFRGHIKTDKKLKRYL